MSTENKSEPLVSHMNIDPNASEETKAAVGDVIRAAYDFRPGGSLSVNIRTWRDKITDLKPHRIDSLADHAERLEDELAAAKSITPQPAKVQALEQTIADLRARVEAMQKAGDAMYKRLGSDIDYLRIDAKAEATRERDEWLSTTTPTPTDHE